MEDIVRRAFTAWFRSGGTDQPANTSDLVKYQGKEYVVLENAKAVLAVYRVRAFDGRLRRMVRPPKDILENGTGVVGVAGTRSKMKPNLRRRSQKPARKS